MINGSCYHLIATIPVGGRDAGRLKSQGFTILLVEQNFRFASTVADRYYIVEHGKVIDGFGNSELSANMDKLHTYLGV